MACDALERLNNIGLNVKIMKDYMIVLGMCEIGLENEGAISVKTPTTSNSGYYTITIKTSLICGEDKTETWYGNTLSEAVENMEKDIYDYVTIPKDIYHIDMKQGSVKI